MSARREPTETTEAARAALESQASAPVLRVTLTIGAVTAEARAGSREPAADADAAPAFVSGTHADSFVADTVARCDVCDAEVADDDDEEGEGYAVPGRGLYVWARGEDVRREEPRLCGDCAAAVGVSALARWEIEEEEG